MIQPPIYRYVWGPRFRVPGLPVLDRKGQLCRVLARGAMNSAAVEFEDGYTAIVSRNALRRVWPSKGDNLFYSSERGKILIGVTGWLLFWAMVVLNSVNWKVFL